MNQRTAILVPLLAAAATAQATHTQLFPAISPSARAGIHAVCDVSDLYVFGGLTAAGTPPTFSQEMWSFDGSAWTNRTPAVSPPARDWYASAFDGARNRYVLFGGRVLSGTTTVDVGDTWEFDGTSWTQLAPAVTPAARRWSAMMFEPTTNRCILFGGSAGGTTYLGDTWAWNGTAWTLLSPANSPSARGRGWLEWDMIRGRGLYFGGRNTAVLTDTWSWDGADWTQVPTTVQPGWNGGDGLIAYGMTYDVMRDRFVLTGGTRTSASVSPETWEFDGTDWQLHNSGTLPGRTAPAVGYSITYLRTFVFGGSGGVNPLGDTWEYQTAAWPGFTPFGAGCSGPVGVPQMVPTAASWLGETAAGTVAGLATTGLCALAIGLSNSAWAGGALPFPLQFVYPQTQSNCQLLVSPDVTLLLTNQAGSADYSLALPPSSAYAGVRFHLQAAQLDATLALSVSAGATMTLGAK